MQQKRYSKEFKDSTIQLVLNGDKSATEVANNIILPMSRPLNLFL